MRQLFIKKQQEAYIRNNDIFRYKFNFLIIQDIRNNELIKYAYFVLFVIIFFMQGSLMNNVIDYSNIFIPNYFFLLFITHLLIRIVLIAKSKKKDINAFKFLKMTFKIAIYDFVFIMYLSLPIVITVVKSFDKSELQVMKSRIIDVNWKKSKYSPLLTFTHENHIHQIKWHNIQIQRTSYEDIKMNKYYFNIYVKPGYLGTYLIKDIQIKAY